jgi:ribose transport system substrate-binding protein
MYADEKRLRRVTLTLCLALLCVGALAIAGCGSSGDDTSSSGSTTASGGGSTEGETGSAGSAGQKEAAAFAEKYAHKPTPFPADEPLEEAPKPGLKIAFMDCGTSVCGLIKSIAEPAVETAGGQFIDVKTGTSAATVNSAVNSLLQQEPDIILDGGVDPALWRPALEKIKAAGIPVTSTGVAELEGKYGLDEPPNAIVYGIPAGELFGKIQANYAYGEFGDGASYLVPSTPAIAATKVTGDTFQSEMENLCSDCKVTQLAIQPEELTTTAPATIVSALQRESDTTAVVAASDEIIEGLPPALQAAGLDTPIIGANGTPLALQYLKEGKEKATVALDFGTMVWSMVDAGLRGVQGMPPSKPEEEGIPVLQLLQPENVNFDPAKGWSGYPNFPEMFAELWKVGK